MNENENKINRYDFYMTQIEKWVKTLEDSIGYNFCLEQIRRCIDISRLDSKDDKVSFE